MPNVQFVLETQEAKAVQGFLKVLDAAKKTEGGVRQVTKESDKLAESLKRIGAVFASGAIIQQGLSAILGMMRQWDQYMSSIANKIQESSKGMMTFSLMQDPGTRNQRLREVSKLSASYGVAPDRAWDIQQSVMSMPGYNYKSALDATKHILTGSQAGMDTDKLTDFVAAVTQKKLSAWEGVYLPYMAGLQSHKTPETMTSASRAIPLWDDPYLAMAAASPVLASTSPDEYHTFLMNAGRALSSEQGAEGKLWKKLKVSGKSQQEKLVAMQMAGLDTVPEIEKQGIKETRDTRGLAAIVNAWPQVMKNYAGLKANASPTYVAGQVSSVLAEVPQVNLAVRSRVLSAEGDASTLTEAEGIRGQAREVMKQKMGLEMKQSGFGWMNEADGKVGSWAMYSRGLFGRWDAPIKEYHKSLFDSGVATPGERKDYFRDLAGDSLQSSQLLAGKMGITEGEFRGYASNKNSPQYLPSEEIVKKLIVALENNTKAREADNKAAPRRASAQTE